MTYGLGNDLFIDGVKVGTFSSHWAVCAAMLRLSNPNFVSLGGDRAEDLAIEQKIRRAVDA